MMYFIVFICFLLILMHFIIKIVNKIILLFFADTINRLFENQLHKCWQIVYLNYVLKHLTSLLPLDKNDQEKLSKIYVETFFKTTPLYYQSLFLEIYKDKSLLVADILRYYYNEIVKTQTQIRQLQVKNVKDKMKLNKMMVGG